MKDGFIKVAAATPDVRVADCEYNATEIIRMIHEMEEQGAKVMVFPELCITAYTCGDLFWQENLLEEAKVQLVRIAEETKAMLKRMVESGEVDALVPERVTAEIRKALKEAKPSIFFDELETNGFMGRVYPEWKQTELSRSLLDGLSSGFTEEEKKAFPYMYLAATIYLFNWATDYFNFWEDYNEYEWYYYLAHIMKAMHFAEDHLDDLYEIISRV